MMTPEVTALTLAGLLQMAQFGVYSWRANRELGVGYTTSARDRPPSRELSPVTLRLQRAFNNHFEGLILFTLAVVVVTLAGKGSALTAACGWVYLGARVLYIPAYALGLRPWRSVVWCVGWTATLVMMIAALIP